MSARNTVKEVVGIITVIAFAAFVVGLVWLAVSFLTKQSLPGTLLVGGALGFIVCLIAIGLLGEP